MPRLRKGEIAPGIKARSDAARRSVEARLTEFKRLSSRCDPEWASKIALFTSLRRLADWRDDALGVAPISAKTLKSHLAKLVGGYSQLQEEVRQILGGNNEGLHAETAMRATEADNGLDVAMEMTARYLDLLERVRRMAATSSACEAEWLRHLRRYGSGPASLRVVK